MSNKPPRQIISSSIAGRLVIDSFRARQEAAETFEAFAGEPMPWHPDDPGWQRLAAKWSYPESWDLHWLAIYQWILGKAETGWRPPGSEPIAEQSTSALDENELRQMLLAMGAEECTLQLWQIARDREKALDDRMREILQLDRRYAGFDSNQWATFLGGSSSAIRQTATWKALQQAKRND